MQQINKAAHSIQQLEDKYHLVSKKTGELHEACEVLVLEQVRINLSIQLTQYPYPSSPYSRILTTYHLSTIYIDKIGIVCRNN